MAEKKKIALLGNISGSLLKGFVLKLDTTMLNTGFREKLMHIVQSNKGNIPLSMLLYDPETKYKIEFMSRKFKVAVSNPFINDLQDMNISYYTVQK